MKDQLQSVQILRAIAALAVVAFHFAQSLAIDFKLIPMDSFTMGADGVDIFFVISGFIMAYTTAREDQRSPGEFAWKRLVRIVPLYWVLTLAVFAMGIVAPTLLNSGGATWEELGKSLAFIPYERTDGRVQPVLFLGWTLNYEMFFYAVFTLALLLAPRWRLQVVVGVMAVMAAIGYAYPGDLGVLGRFYTNGIILEFVWGCLLFVAWNRWPPRLRAVAPIWILGTALLLLQNFWNVPLPREIEKGLPVLMIVAGVLALTVRDGAIPRLFRAIGDASYSLYLGHPYAIGLFVKLSVALLGGTVLGALVAGTLTLAVSVAAALLSFHLLERPSNTLLRGLWPAGPRSPLKPAIPRAE